MEIQNTPKISASKYEKLIQITSLDALTTFTIVGILNIGLLPSCHLHLARTIEQENCTLAATMSYQKSIMQAAPKVQGIAPLLPSLLPIYVATLS